MIAVTTHCQWAIAGIYPGNGKVASADSPSIKPRPPPPQALAVGAAAGVMLLLACHRRCRRINRVASPLPRRLLSFGTSYGPCLLVIVSRFMLSISCMLHCRVARSSPACATSLLVPVFGALTVHACCPAPDQCRQRRIRISSCNVLLTALLWCGLLTCGRS
jgi:hypothetical protein